jgi:hypothetical protein
MSSPQQPLQQLLASLQTDPGPRHVACSDLVSPDLSLGGNRDREEERREIFSLSVLSDEHSDPSEPAEGDVLSKRRNKATTEDSFIEEKLTSAFSKNSNRK